MNVTSLFKNLSMEYKASILFALCALMLSLIFGVVFGVGAGTVALRSLFMTLFFAGLGFGIIAVLRRYVPEVYTLLEGMSTDPVAAEGATDEEGEAREYAREKKAEAAADDGGAAVPDRTFNELSEEDFTKLTSNVDGIGSDRKLGKHIISDEKIVSYEPRIMAQAVRTMMRRDED
ncbi:MAG: hypothetical protein JXA20_03250 [Spirochaetes bacterium]|nr:hypothetical protein [Spirochaetota bacterium]